MTANAKMLAPSHTIITELVVAIVKQVELPLEIAKLEGDAVFSYCRKENGPSWTDAIQAGTNVPAHYPKHQPGWACRIRRTHILAERVLSSQQGPASLS
jgi:hypothetical protein